MASETPSECEAKTILIVDDMPANLGVLTSHLERQGYMAVVAQGGEEGIERAHFVRPDLILLDVMMPGLDGFETCRRLKATRATRDIPVVFMTALTDTSDKLKGFAVGGVDYVTKPLDGAEVLARIDTHLTLYGLRQRLEEQNEHLQAEIVARRETEAALFRSNTELEQLAYVASHDMQEPLRMVASYLQIVAALASPRNTSIGSSCFFSACTAAANIRAPASASRPARRSWSGTVVRFPCNRKWG